MDNRGWCEKEHPALKRAFDDWPQNDNHFHTEFKSNHYETDRRVEWRNDARVWNQFYNHIGSQTYRENEWHSEGIDETNGWKTWNQEEFQGVREANEEHLRDIHALICGRWERHIAIASVEWSQQI